MGRYYLLENETGGRDYTEYTMEGIKNYFEPAEEASEKEIEAWKSIKTADDMQEFINDYVNFVDGIHYHDYEVVKKMEDESMTMKRYELKKLDREVKDEKEIKKGCTLCQDALNFETVEVFDSKEAALEELKNYRTTVEKMNNGAWSYYLVTEFYVEENEYDDDEWINGGDIIGISEMKN